MAGIDPFAPGLALVLGRSYRGLCRQFRRRLGMAEAKLAPSLPQWMVDHANRYISSGGKEGHIYTVTPPGYSEMHVPSLLLTNNRPEVGREVYIPAVLRRGRQELYHSGLERRRSPAPQLVSEPRR